MSQVGGELGGGSFGPPPPWKAERPIWRRPWFLAVFAGLLVVGVALLLLEVGSRLLDSSDTVLVVPSEREGTIEVPAVPNPGAQATESGIGALACLPTDAETRNAIVETLRGGVTPVVDATLGTGLGSGAGTPLPIVAMSVVLPNGKVAVGTWLAPPAGPVRSYDKVARRASTAPPAPRRARLDAIISEARGCLR